MAKNVKITPASGKIEFAQDSSVLCEVIEVDGHLYIKAPMVVLGDGATGVVQLGDATIPVSLEMLGGGALTSKGNIMDIGEPGDTINLNVPGVTYILPDSMPTNTTTTGEPDKIVKTNNDGSITTSAKGIVITGSAGNKARIEYDDSSSSIRFRF